MRNIFTSFLVLILSTSSLFAQWTKTSLTQYAFSLTNDGENLYAGTLAGGVYKSADNGTTWIEVNNGITIKEVWSMSSVGNSIFAGTKSGGLYQSTDKGNSWTPSNTGIPSTTIVRAVVRFGSNLYASTSNSGVYMSSDNGNSWTQHNSGISGLVANPLLATDSDLFAGVLQKVYRYDPANSKWTASSSGIVNNTISAISYMKDNSGKTNLFAAISNSGSAVFRSTDNGSSWNAVDNGLPKVPVATLAVVGSNIFAGNDYGVYVSEDLGANWKDANDGFIGASYATFLTPGKTDLFVIYKGGVWIRPYAGMITSINDNANEIPDEFSLSQNYPNPFNPSTTIFFQIPNASVTLKVYDILGREVASLVNESKSAGTYEVKFNGDNLPSGMYIYKLDAGNFSAVKKMILMK